MASGLIFPTAFAILPSGNRVLMLEKEGYVRLVENGVLKPTKVLDITSQLNNYHDRGLHRSLGRSLASHREVPDEMTLFGRVPLSEE